METIPRLGEACVDARFCIWVHQSEAAGTTRACEKEGEETRPSEEEGVVVGPQVATSEGVREEA